MVSLLDLPNEILGEIASLLPPSALNQLGRSCRHFHTLTRPHLYTDISVWDGEAIRPLTRTVIENSHLASLVKILSLSADNDVPSDENLRDNAEDVWAAIDFSLLEVISRLTHSTNEIDDWVHAIPEASTDVHVGLLISSLPALQSLAITWPLEPVYLEKAILYAVNVNNTAPSTSSTHAPALSTLRSVQVSHWDTEGGVSLLELLPFFALPSLEEFHGFMIIKEEYGPESWGEEYKPGTSPVKILDLRNSAINALTLETLVKLPSALEEFTYHDGGAIVGDVEPYAFDIGKILESTRKSLRSLELALDDWDPLSWGRETSIGSLAEFEKLERITVPAVLLLEASEKLRAILPKSLKVLQLTNWQYGELEEIIVELLRSKSGEIVPALERIELHIDGQVISHSGDMEDRFKSIVRLSRVGVEVGVDVKEWRGW